ncbi:MAG: BolA/IbaG family iron-sulfur metabolism protein [Methylococcales bacterium]
MNETPDMSSEMKQRIERSILDAKVEVVPRSGRHYEISVVSASFEGLSLVKRQQQVYAAITDLMGGDNAPVHAIDRLQTRSS